MHDLVIRNGHVVDGSGAPGRPADVAIDGDRIVGVGSVDGRGRREVDADGLVVTPGFVDIHTHYDGQATWDPEVSPSSWHGVTTVVMGNCGVGFAPAHPDRHGWLIQLMEGVEDIPGTALAEGITWNWETFPEYLDELDRLPRVLDVSALVPHGAVRAYVMGERGGANAEAKPAEIAAMSALVREAMEAGAMGFSTTRTIIHRAKDGELAAGTTASPEELVGIGRALASTGAGQARGSARVPGVFELASDMVDPEGELAWMTELSRATGCRVTFGTGQDHMRPDHWRTILDLVRRANAAGAHIVPQVGGRSTSVLFGLESSAHPFMLHAAYAGLADLPLPERVERLRDPGVRAAILGETLHDAGAAAFIADAWGHMFPLGDPPDYEPPPDRSVAALAERQGRPPAEVGYDLLLEREGRALLYMPLGGYADGDFRALAELLTQPDVVLGLGDGVPTVACCATPACRPTCSATGSASAAAASDCRWSWPSTCRPGGRRRCSASTTGASWRPAISPTSTSSTPTTWRARRQRWSTTCRRAGAGWSSGLGATWPRSSGASWCATTTQPRASAPAAWCGGLSRHRRTRSSG
jgi:N-acyl-D-amino-acid deacylase